VSAASSDSQRGEWIAVAALAALPLLPFLSAAVSIDAPVFLAVARQIVAHPADPFGFDMIWDPTSAHVAAFNHNPPLLSYYLAPWIAAFGEREAVLHVALLPFPLLAALSFRGIARRLAGRGLAPAALLVATPAFLVLATTLMLDVPMLAWLLFAVYALLRAREAPSSGWQLAAGCAAAAAGMTKYAGLMSAPLLAASLVWLPPAAAPGAERARQRGWAALRLVGVPLAVWASWGIYTHQLYGVPHFAGGLALVGARSFAPDTFWNHALSVPIYYAGALLFPLFVWVGSFRAARRDAGLGVLGLLLGALAVYAVLPAGEPPRRVPLDGGQALMGAACLAAATLVWGRALRPGRVLATPEDRFLGVWLLGALAFSLLINWHVNAADALLAAPPLILLSFRDPALRASRRALAIGIGGMFAFSMLLAASDVQQRDVYRTVAPRIAAEIGAQPGRRWFVGHWGLQYYLEREGFRAIVPPQYERSYGASRLEKGDWVVSARNVSQLDVRRILARHRVRPAWHWSVPAALALRATHADAGAGFYSHRVGYTPFSWSLAPLEEVGLGRIEAIRHDTPR
jgi:4-amino-4-deoxy-L-arabinose transferase-like glycosyltransferase